MWPLAERQRRQAFVALVGLMAVLAPVAALPARAQGTIRFFSGSCGPGICTGCVYDSDSRSLLTGTNYLAQLYVGAVGSREEDLKAVDYPPVPFMSGLLAGCVNGGTYTLAGFPPRTQVFVQVRAWTEISGSSYEEAVQTGMSTMAFDHRFGKSNIIEVRLSDPDLGEAPW